MRPQIAILLPTRNRATSLARTLDHLRRQTCRDFVIRISDNGSTDATRQLGASSFPDLPILWKRRDPGLPGLAEHYNVLLSEVEEPLLAIAHDDERYAPYWLEDLKVLLERAGPAAATVAMGGWVIADARAQPARYYRPQATLKPGVYDAQQVKRAMLFEGGALCGQGFLLRTDAARAAGPVPVEYEQYDYAWLMRIIERGGLAVADRVMNTHTVHASNTLCSPEYLLEYSRRRQANELMMEWLATLEGVSPAERATEVARRFRFMARGDLMSMVRAIGVGAGPALAPLRERLRTNPEAGARDRALALALAQPAVRLCLAPWLRLALQWRSRQPIRKHPSWRECPVAEMDSAFGSLSA